MNDPYEMIEHLPRKKKRLAWIIFGVMMVILWIAIIVGTLLLF